MTTHSRAAHRAMTPRFTKVEYRISPLEERKKCAARQQRHKKWRRRRKNGTSTGTDWCLASQFRIAKPSCCSWKKKINHSKQGSKTQSNHNWLKTVIAERDKCSLIVCINVKLIRDCKRDKVKCQFCSATSSTDRSEDWNLLQLQISCWYAHLTFFLAIIIHRRSTTDDCVYRFNPT